MIATSHRSVGTLSVTGRALFAAMFVLAIKTGRV